MRHGELVDRIGKLGARLITELKSDLIMHYNPDARHIRTTAPFRRGFPDMVISGIGGTLFAELKCRDDTLSPDQRKWSDMLGRGGLTWVTWQPADLFSGRIETDLCVLSDRYGQLGADPGSPAGAT